MKQGCHVQPRDVPFYRKWRPCGYPPYPGNCIQRQPKKMKNDGGKEKYRRNKNWEETGSRKSSIIDFLGLYKYLQPKWKRSTALDYQFEWFLAWHWRKGIVVPPKEVDLWYHQFFLLTIIWKINIWGACYSYKWCNVISKQLL